MEPFNKALLHAAVDPTPSSGADQTPVQVQSYVGEVSGDTNTYVSWLLKLYPVYNNSTLGREEPSSVSRLQTGYSTRRHDISILPM